LEFHTRKLKGADDLSLLNLGRFVGVLKRLKAPSQQDLSGSVALQLVPARDHHKELLDIFKSTMRTTHDVAFHP